MLILQMISRLFNPFDFLAYSSILPDISPPFKNNLTHLNREENKRNAHP